MLGRMDIRGVTRAGLGRLAFAACIGAVLLTVSACTKVQAKTPGPAPAPAPLAVPEPPIRLQIPVDLEPPPPPPATEKPTAPVTPATRIPRPTPTPTPTPPATTGETTAPPVVQTRDQAQNETRAREQLQNAVTNLARVQPPLGRAAQDQYESAQKFVRMTREALSARNYVYAVYCAEKAATLAAMLVKG
jgi:outer membrane biosynthesis protein TonB